MTDERLNQILKQALAPEIRDSEIQIRRKVRKNKMNAKKIIAVGLATCAALTLVITGGYFLGHSKPDENGGRNIFAITAYAAELSEKTVSGDVIGLNSYSAGHGSSLFLDQRFAISGKNISKVKISTDKCNIYSALPIYKGDPDFEKAKIGEVSGTEMYEMIVDEEFEYDEEHATEPTSFHYEHLVVEGNSYEDTYNDKVSFGMSVPENLWSDSYDLREAYWSDVDQVNGAKITIVVTFKDGSTEEHHYRVNTGRIYVPVDEAGFLQWDQLTRFLTSEEESSGDVPCSYGYLLEKID